MIAYLDGVLSPRKPGKGQVEQGEGVGQSKGSLTLHPPTVPRGGLGTVCHCLMARWARSRAPTEGHFVCHRHPRTQPNPTERSQPLCPFPSQKGTAQHGNTALPDFWCSKWCLTWYAFSPYR